MAKPDRTPWFRLALLVGIVLVVGQFWSHPALWPLRIVVVLFHELGHAAAAWATGGEVLAIDLSPTEGGHTLSRGGIPVIILNAGYLGSLITGLGLIAAGRLGVTARAATAALALCMAWVTVAFVPWFTFAFVFTGVAALVVGAASALVPGFVLRHAVRVFGVFSVLYAFVDVWSDVLSRAAEGAAGSDAAQLATLTGVPAGVWGVAWVLAGLGLLIGLRRWLV